jgi:hypothetical protein
MSNKKPKPVDPKVLSNVRGGLSDASAIALALIIPQLANRQ